MGDHSVSSLLGQPALLQLLTKLQTSAGDKEKKELIKKIETQCQSFNGKGKLTIDEYYSVIKVQVKLVFLNSRALLY